MINKDKYNSLPTDLKLVIDIACKAINLDMLSDYTAKNNLALQFLKSENIDILKFPNEVLTKLKEISDEILKEISSTDEITNEVYKSYVSFKEDVEPWTDISDKSYLDIR